MSVEDLLSPMLDIDLAAYYANVCALTRYKFCSIKVFA